MRKRSPVQNVNCFMSLATVQCHITGPVPSWMALRIAQSNLVQKMESVQPVHLDRNDRKTILNSIRKLVPAKHINVSSPHQDYASWVALLDSRRPALESAGSVEEFETGVRELLAWELVIRHFFESGKAFRQSTRFTRLYGLSQMAMALSAGCSWMSSKMVRLIKLVSVPVNSSRRPMASRWFRQHSRDSALAAPIASMSSDLTARRAPSSSRSPTGEPKTAHQWLNRANGWETVSPRKCWFASTGFRQVKALETEGLGPQPFHGRIAMLVNEFTSSAAEMVASFAAENKLATLIGTRTGGQVLGGANLKLPKGYRLRMPVAGWYTWRGECIEGRGVAPDVEIDLNRETLAHGMDTQLEAAVNGGTPSVQAAECG